VDRHESQHHQAQDQMADQAAILPPLVVHQTRFLLARRAATVYHVDYRRGTKLGTEPGIPHNEPIAY
jgi:hypothetical protein